MYPGTYAKTTPDKPAIIMAGSGKQLTYRELDEQSAKLARALHDLGLRKGDVFAMLSDNQAECLMIYWAALRSGLYITAINYHLTADEVGYILTDCEAKVLFTSGSLVQLGQEVIEAAPRGPRRDPRGPGWPRPTGPCGGRSRACGAPTRTRSTS